MSRRPVERVLLVGAMGSGKTTVGALLAGRLGWSHFDLDREIQRTEGRSIAEIFARDGEARFRALEEEVSARALRCHRCVVSTGGGWVTGPGAWQSVPPGTLSAWLQVSPERAVRRVAADAAAPERPLLRGPDPEGRARALLAAREPLYARAELAIPTDARSADEIADELETQVRGRNGTPD